MRALNPQGMSRGEPALMRAIIPDPGYTVVSVDLSAGEPTVVSHYSRDKLFVAGNFGLVGKRPYWDGDLLMIGDQYIMTASVSPLGKDLVRKWWDEGLADEWVRDSDAYQRKVKKDRAFFKILSLGLLYEMGAGTLALTAAKIGRPISQKDAKAFHSLFWKDLFPDVKRARDRYMLEFRRKGWLVNEFGYRFIPEEDYKSFNGMIQSSVSGIIKHLWLRFYQRFPQAFYNCVIHDELVFQVPTELLAEAKLVMQEALAELNNDLGWSVPIRTGWAIGKDFYEAK